MRRQLSYTLYISLGKLGRCYCYDVEWHCWQLKKDIVLSLAVEYYSS